MLTAQAMAELGSLIAEGQNQQLARARVGRTALTAKALADSAELPAGVSALCPFETWPERALRLSAVDADNGEFVTLEKSYGVSLRDAIIASCALPFVYPPAQVANRRWIDGFIRSPANVDLADKCQRIVVLAPMAQGFSPAGAVPDQVHEIRERTGAAVAMVVADESVEAVNVNPMDPAHLPAVAEAGRRQAASVAGEIAEVWA
ncbi:hypothetical protein Lesp02_78790 [Lentzea sp. NBRC 105346]|nr:hypothetical protein Lesp02_78790 [Lentzea sp. NBRC 105346]